MGVNPTRSCPTLRCTLRSYNTRTSLLIHSESFETAALDRNREPLAEFTFQAVCTGIVLGIVFGAANAYMGLRVGMTVSASIPAAVMTVAIFAALGRKATILEANLSQTVAFGLDGPGHRLDLHPARLVSLGRRSALLAGIVALCFLGGLLGLAAMIPLRRLLIVQSRDELPYPEGTACAEVLMATTRGGRRGWIFAGMAIGAAVKLLVGLFLLPDMLVLPLAFLPKAEFTLELSAALIGVGFLLGYRQSAVCVAGSLLSSLALIPLIAWLGEGLTGPLPPETKALIAGMSSDDIWKNYVRYIGAGAVATAGILTVLRGLPAMSAAFLAVARGIGARHAPRGNDRTRHAPRDDIHHAERGEYASTDRDLPGAFILAAIAVVVLVPALVPGVLGGHVGFLPRLACSAGIALFGLLFVAVTARIVGIVGVSSQPTSGIALVTLLGTAALFAAAGWTDLRAQAAVLTVGTIVAIAASKSGDISQDLKTGYLVGATPAKQQFGQLLGAATACWAVAATLTLLGTHYGFGGKACPHRRPR